MYWHSSSISFSTLWVNWAQITIHLLCTVIILSSLTQESFVCLRYTYSPVQTPLVCLAESDLTCPTSFHCSFRLASPYLQYAFNHSNPPHNPRSIKCCLNANSFCALIYPPLWFQAFYITKLCVHYDKLCKGLCICFAFVCFVQKSQSVIIM